MLRKIVITLLIFISFLLESAVFNHFALANVVPKFTIILTSAFGFMRGEEEGMVIGFCCGFLNDIFFGDVLGFYALILTYIGYINGKFSRIFYPEDIKLPIALIVVSDLSYGVMCYILLFLLRGRFYFPYYFTAVILPEALYTIVVTVFVYPVILKVNQLLEVREKRSAQKFV